MLRLRTLLLAMLLLPFAEFIAFSAVSARIGFLPAFVTLCAGSMLGVALLRREGGRLFQAIRQGGVIVLQGNEARDGLLIGLGGLLLAIPGFITDALGLLCLLPAAAALVRPIPRGSGRSLRPDVIDLAPHEWQEKRGDRDR